jgi:hypothetical protein
VANNESAYVHEELVKEPVQVLFIVATKITTTCKEYALA